MNCERCDSMWGEEAAFRIRSDILNLKVCGQCAKEASDLQLMVKPLMNDCPVTPPRVEITDKVKRQLMNNDIRWAHLSVSQLLFPRLDM
jgi:hypothetical protein